MKIRNSVIVKTLLIGSLFSLGGCVSGLSTLTKAVMPAEEKQAEGSISVEELLANARSNKKSSTTEALYLKFDPQRKAMNKHEEQQILEYAQQDNTPLFLSCAPSDAKDRFSAAALGIQRCQKISIFLGQNKFSSEIELSPSLQVNQIRVHR